MNPRYLAVFFLTLFLQAITYPAVVFAVYVDIHDSETTRSLPDDFPDNGSSCFFGLNNNEEENETQNGNLFVEINKLYSETSLTELSLRQSYQHKVYLDNAHPEITTPPPESW